MTLLSIRVMILKILGTAQKKGVTKMPGVLHHLYFAEEVFRQVEIELNRTQTPFEEEGDELIFPVKRAKLSKSRFYLGNVLPDIASDKEKTHFKVDSVLARGFRVPELFYASKQLEKVEDSSYRLGICAHLFLDKKFIERFVYPRFQFNWDEDKIVNHRSRRVYTVKDFFSSDGLYCGYSELNRAIENMGLVDFEYLAQLPEWPEQIGMAGFDTWREESWKEELDRYLIDATWTQETVFLTDDFINFIEKFAMFFVKFEMNEYL